MSNFWVLQKEAGMNMQIVNTYVWVKKYLGSQLPHRESTGLGRLWENNYRMTQGEQKSQQLRGEGSSFSPLAQDGRIRGVLLTLAHQDRSSP